MKRFNPRWTGTLLALGWLLAALVAAGGRMGGQADLLYERVGAGGVSFATDGTTKLGASIGQGVLPYMATNSSGEACLNGFWKAEGACTLYNPTITDILAETNQVSITFMVVNDNTYSVEYIDIEAGGLEAGVHRMTNEVLTLTGVGLAGSTTTVFHNVSSSTNRAKFYLIRCEE